jgi:hypothetical protein
MSETFEALEEEMRAALSPHPEPWLRMDVLFRKLLSSKDARAARLAVDVLHGTHGPQFSRCAWRAVETGLPLHFQQFVSQGTMRYSLAALCVMRGTVATFEAVVLAGAPDSVPPELKPRDLVEWIDLVSTTDRERAALNLESMTNPAMTPIGAVGEIASFADLFPGPAQEGLEVVWRLAPHHPGFDAVSQEPSEAGAMVRAFVMSKKMATVSQDLPAGESPAASPRRRRARGL